MSSNLLLNVKDLHAGYGRAEVLHGLSLSAKKGGYSGFQDLTPRPPRDLNFLENSSL